MAYDLGLPTPNAAAGGFDTVTETGPWGGLFTDGAIDYMSRVQYHADGNKSNGTITIGALPWGEIPKDVLNS